MSIDPATPTDGSAGIVPGSALDTGGPGAAAAAAGSAVAGGVDAGLNAVGSAAGSAISALIAPIQTWINSIESGMAHAIDVIFNNAWYAGICFMGLVGMAIGGYFLLGETIGKTATKIAKVAAV